MKEKEQGRFWLPTNPEKKIDGEITLDSEYGPVLRTYGELAQSGPLPDGQKVINGLLADDHIKLVNCSTTSTAIGTETTWYCELAFRGDDYCGDVPSKISSVEATIESLGDWTPGFEGIHLAEDRSSLSWPVKQPDQSSPWETGHSRPTPRDITLIQHFKIRCQKRNSGTTHFGPNKIRRATVVERGNSYRAKPSGTRQYSQRGVGAH